MNIEKKIYSTRKRFECVREENAHLATLKVHKRENFLGSDIENCTFS
jgi:hypothetical protein